jgi:hypothetical protein
MTYINGTVTRAEGRRQPIDVRFIVDSGAIYSVTRGVSRCTFEIAGISDTSPVVLGGPRDAPLLGMVTLETLGLMLNPLTRELLPMKLVLAALAPRAA